MSKKRIYMDNSDFIEGVCEMADRVVRQRFGNAGYILADPDNPDAGTVYSEEAQNVFNEEYDDIESGININFGIFSETDKKDPKTNILYTIEVQDGERRRYEYRLEQLPVGVTKVDINTKGDEIAREMFTGNVEGDWSWDNYGEIMGRYYTYNVVSDETYETLNLMGI